MIDHLIDEAYNGEQAMLRVKQLYESNTQQYGLIITDCCMPIVDGYQFAIQAREFYREKRMIQPQIIAVTGNTDDASTDMAWNAQMDEVIFKPANHRVLQPIL